MRLIRINYFQISKTGYNAVCMPHMDKQCANLYAKDMSLNAERQRLRCAWALKPRSNGRQKKKR